MNTKLETLELLGVESGYSTPKLIHVLKQNTNYSTIEILDVLNKLDCGKSVVIELKDAEIVDYNLLITDLNQLNVLLGSSSFHQEV